MSDVARTKLLELTRLMVDRFLQSGWVNLAELTAKHGGDEHRATLAKILEMLEVWVALRTNDNEQEPQQFATGFGAADVVRDAFLEAVVVWRMGQEKPGDEDDAPSEAPSLQEPIAKDDGQDSDQESVVTGQSLVSVRNWNGCGVGGAGEVADGVDVILHRDVAVKSPRHPSYPRFEKEILLTGSFVHPHIIPVFSLAFNKDGKPAFIMPRVKGGTLLNAINAHHEGELLGQARDRSLHSLLRHVVTVARTVQYAHSRMPAVMHRDLKPENILLDADENLFVADWGHGYRADEPEEPTPGFGTVYYAAPEQWAGTNQGISIDGNRLMNAIRANYPMETQLALASEVQRGQEWPEACEAVGIGFVDLLGQAGYDLAGEFSRPGRLADIYSLGATLYHAVTGQRPFSNSSNADKLQNRFANPDQLAPGVSPELAGIIRKAMATAPGGRYASAGEFADDLERVMGRFVDEPVKAFKPGEEPLGVRARRTVRRHAGVIAALLLLFGFTAITGISCTAERHFALQHEQERASTEVQDIRRESARTVAAERGRADAAIKSATDEAADKVAAARENAERKVFEQQEKAARDVEAERARTRSAEAERDELRRRLTRTEFRADLSARVEEAQQARPRQALADGDRVLVDRFARSVELGIAESEADRLETRRAPSQEIRSHVVREEILHRTSPEATDHQTRPKLEIAENIVLDYHSRIAWERPPSSQAAQAFRDRLARICECDGAMLDRIRTWSQTPASRNPTAGLMHEAIDLVVTGRAEGVSPQVAREAAEHRQIATEQFLYSYLSGKNFDEAMKASQLENSRKFVNVDLLRQADVACVREFSSFPEDGNIVAKLHDNPPSVEGLGFRAGQRDPFGGEPPEEPPGAIRSGGPRPNRPSGGGVDITPPAASDLTPIIQRMARTSGTPGIVSPDYALTYDDLLPPRTVPRDTSLYERLADEHLKAANLPQVDAAPRINPQSLKGIGSPQAAMRRSYSFSRLRGFHRVGGTSPEYERGSTRYSSSYWFLPLQSELP